jgi:hypothetical protein
MMIMMVASALFSRIRKMRTYVKGGGKKVMLVKVGMEIEGARE